MRKIIWSAKAKKDADMQFQYLADRSTQGLTLVRDRLYETVQSLAKMPIGRTGRNPGVFEKLVLKTSLIVVYELPNEEAISILRVIHTSREWLSNDWPKETI